MRHQRHTLLVAALVVAVITAIPGGAVAADDLSVSGDQADDGTVTVTVAENNTTVTNASVTVEALNNSSYVGAGTYTTDENGTVTLSAPEQNVSVSVTATADNTTAETTLDLVVPTDDSSDISVNVTQADDGNATVSVTNASGAGVANASVSVSKAGNVTYAGTDNYTTGENGTVSLPAPEQNVTVDVVAETNNVTAETTATLTVSENGNATESFGERVSAFVAALQAEGNMSGQEVAAFVVDNNPSADNRPDHVDPGPKDDDSEKSDEDESNDGNEADGNNGNGHGADGNNGNGADAANGGNGNNENGNNGNGPSSDDDSGGPGNGNGNAGGNGPGNGNGNPGSGN